MTNQFRSPVFIKIKHNILSSTNFLHLTSCAQMLDNADGILGKDELTILNEYLNDKAEKLKPITQ